MNTRIAESKHKARMAEIKFRVLCAAGGPWNVVEDNNISRTLVAAPNGGFTGSLCEVRSPHGNAVFIANAREDVPYLSDAVEIRDMVLERILIIHKKKYTLNGYKCENCSVPYPCETAKSVEFINL